MIRLLTRRAAGPQAFLRWIIHPDPDAIGHLEVQFGNADLERKEIVTQFSRIVSGIRVGRVHKLTRPDRLAEGSRCLARLLRDQSGSEVHLLDVGASDGVTTLEAVEQLESALGTRVRATLMDQYTTLECRGAGWIREYRMQDGAPVMVRFGALGLELSSLDSTRDPLARWLGRRWLAYRARRGPLPVTRTLPLVSPVVRNAGVRVVEWNLLERNPKLVDHFDVVRASNVLNKSYFRPEQIRRALMHLHRYLKSRGLLLVSRNHTESEGEIEHGSIWRRTAWGFERLHDYAGGSYIAELVDDIRIEEEGEQQAL